MTKRKAKEAEEPCRWFAMCDNPATDMVPHSILGDVPVCERCKAWIARMEKK